MPKLTRLPPPKELIEIKDLDSLKKAKALYDNKLLTIIFWRKDIESSLHIKGVCEELAKASVFTHFASVSEFILLDKCRGRTYETYN